MKIENEEEVARYYKLKKKLELVQEQMSTVMNEPKYLIPFMQPGRLVTVSAAQSLKPSPRQSNSPPSVNRRMNKSDVSVIF